MTDFILYGSPTKRTYVVTATSWVRAVQAVIAVTPTTASDWRADRLSDHNDKQAQILRDRAVAHLIAN